MNKKRVPLVNRRAAVRIRTTSIALAAILLLTVAPANAGPWSHARGDAANTGLADVITAPASLPSRKITGIGTYAPGAGPVVAADGTVYLGSTQGLLRAFTPAGDAKWMRDTPRRKIVVTPVVGADGSVYVVGTSVARDHRGGRVTLRQDASLYRFTPGGAMPWVRPLPERGQGQGTGATSAAPSIWRWGDTEVIMVPVLHRQAGAYQLRVLAFSTWGGLMFDQRITGWAQTVTGSADWGDALCTIYPFCVNKMLGLEDVTPEPGLTELPRGVEPPMPSVGTFTDRRGGAPVVIIADNYQNIVGYSFSPTQGFQETFRKHLTRDQLRMSSPAVLRDGHSVIRGNGSTQAWVLFGGPNAANWTEVSIPLTGSTPTFTAAGRIVMIDRGGGMTVVGTSPRRSIVSQLRLDGESIASAAASCNHVFVSTVTELVTLDAKAEARVVQFDWRGGGLSSPAISPNGSVYALAGDSLHIFPPPPRRRPSIGITSCLSGPGVNP